MTVDGQKNAVKEVDVVPVPQGKGNPFGNAFRAQHTSLLSECQAQRDAAPEAARSWIIQNNYSINPVNGKPVAYKLLPQTRGPSHPALMTGPESAVTARGTFATKALWVTAHNDSERWPAGDYTVQSEGGVAAGGLPAWALKDRSILDEDVVLWHSFGLVHVPRVEDFPVMPCESTGFTLKPDGFFRGNPTIDLAPIPPGAGQSKCCTPFDKHESDIVAYDSTPC